MRANSEYVATGEMAQKILDDLKREPTQLDIETVLKAQQNRLERRSPTKKGKLAE